MSDVSEDNRTRSQRHLQTAIAADPELHSYCTQYGYSLNALAVVLTYKRFRRFGKRAAKLELLNRDPETLFRRYNDKGQFKILVDAIDDLRKRDLLVCTALFNAWYDIYILSSDKLSFSSP
jgi:hypothetical protein